MNRLSRLPLWTFAMLTLCIAPTAPIAAQSDGWDWSAAIYGWLPDLNISGDRASQSISRGDLLSKVELVLAGHFEGRRGKAGFLVDAMYLELADGRTVDNSEEIPPGSQLDLDLEQLIMELGGFYRPGGGRDGFDVLFGARLIDMSDTLTLTPSISPPIEPPPAPTSRSTSTSLWDGFVGVRYSSKFTDRLGWGVRGDVGTGGTDFTYNALGQVSWNWGADRQHGILLGWRYMDIDLKDDEESPIDGVVFTGPFLAAKFGF